MDLQQLIAAVKEAEECLQAGEGVGLLYYMEMCGVHEDNIHHRTIREALSRDSDSATAGE